MKKYLSSLPFNHIVTFEGTDCSFKETNANKLKDYIENELGYNAIVFSFPNYYSNSSYSLTTYFKEIRKYKELSPKMINMLYVVDFFITWYRQIKQYYDKKYIIIFDRWYYSNIYYQGVRVLKSVVEDLNKDNIGKYIHNEKLVEFINEYENIIKNEFGLVDTDIMFKMIHSKRSTRGLIAERKSENDINEGEVDYLEMVNNLFKHLFIDSNFVVKEIELDKSEDEFKNKEEVFREIALEFKCNLNYRLDKWKSEQSEIVNEA